MDSDRSQIKSNLPANSAPLTISRALVRTRQLELTQVSRTADSERNIVGKIMTTDTVD